jgi:hypothetical protein
MAKGFQSIEQSHRAFIARQHVFFTASAAGTGRINLSPKDAACFRVLDANSAGYLDVTGSGNETAAHILADGRLTCMFTAFEGAPLILRLYGRGQIVHRDSDEFAQLRAGAFAGIDRPGVRQIVKMDVEYVLTSCGYGVPLYEYTGEREQLDRWAEHKGEAGVEDYWREKNVVSQDGFETGIFEKA